MSEPPVIAYRNLTAAERIRRPIRFPIVAILGLIWGLASVVLNFAGIVLIHEWMPDASRPARSGLVRLPPPVASPPQNGNGGPNLGGKTLNRPPPVVALTAGNVWFLLTENALSLCAASC